LLILRKISHFYGRKPHKKFENLFIPEKIYQMTANIEFVNQSDNYIINLLCLCRDCLNKFYSHLSNGNRCTIPKSQIISSHSECEHGLEPDECTRSCDNIFNFLEWVCYHPVENTTKIKTTLYPRYEGKRIDTLYVYEQEKSYFWVSNDERRRLIANCITITN
jgi:hypothetical protein